jgi:histidyl-tRNA synthetase
MTRQDQKLSTKPYKGTRDFYPEDMRLRNWLFNTMRKTARNFGYEEYDGPMLERFEVYAAKSGEELVNEQLYHFKDLGNRHVAIRPEMTPTVARMVAAVIHQIPRPIRWFSLPNLWRYERPQRGRLREHWQFNVDIFGLDTVLADFEIIDVAVSIMLSLGASSKEFQIRISNRRLLNHFLAEILTLNQEQRNAVCKAIDKREKITRDVYTHMLTESGLTPEKIDRLEKILDLDWNDAENHPAFESRGGKELHDLFSQLRRSGLDQYCKLDLSIVRGLDYYTGTVFEMYDLHPENRRALFGGGRYDDLVSMFCNDSLPGVGFGMGDVTIQDFLTTHRLLPDLPPPIEVFVALYDATCLEQSLTFSRQLREAGLRVTVQLEPMKLGKQYKQADQRNIPIVAIQGPDEIQAGTVTLKHMISGEQVVLPSDQSEATIRGWLKSV